MSDIATREALIGADLDSWGPFEQEHNHLGIGVNTRKLFLSGATLVYSKGRIGLFDGTQYYAVFNSADRNLSLASLTATCWAKIELSIVAGNVVTTLTSIAGQTDPNVLPTVFSGAYDATKGGYYISATKRCIGVIWITGAGACDGIINTFGNCDDYKGYAVKNTFKYISGDKYTELHVTTGTGGAGNVTIMLPVLNGLNGRYHIFKEDTGTNKLIADGNGTEKIGVEGNALTFELLSQGDFVTLDDTVIYWCVVSTNGVQYRNVITSSQQQGAAVLNTWYNKGGSLALSPGVYDLYWSTVFSNETDTQTIAVTLSKANNTEDDIDLTKAIISTGAGYCVAATNRKKIVVAASSTFYLNIATLNTGTPTLTMRAATLIGNIIIEAKRIG